MRLRRLVIIAALAAAMAIFVVYENSRMTRAAFRISQLSHDEAKVIDEQRMARIRISQLRQPEFIEQQVQRLRIDLMRLPDTTLVPVTDRTARRVH
jgi:hypothetical protein